jgi:hypothetical protein
VDDLRRVTLWDPEMNSPENRELGGARNVVRPFTEVGMLADDSAEKPRSMPQTIRSDADTNQAVAETHRRSAYLGGQFQGNRPILHRV